jgi:hypothetical protein
MQIGKNRPIAVRNYACKLGVDLGKLLCVLRIPNKTAAVLDKYERFLYENEQYPIYAPLRMLFR